MKKILLLLVLSVVLCLPTFAESMCVNLKNGETVSFDLEDIKDVTICENIPVVDESETPLKFKILSDSTLGVIRDDSYKELNSVSIPAKVRIDGKVYDVTSIGEKGFYECKGLDIVIDNLEEIVKVGYDAFKNCKSVKWLKD